MKALTLLAGCGLAGLLLAQTGFTYRSPKVDPKLMISGKTGWVELDKKFEVEGNVRLDSKADQIVMTGDRMTGDLQKEDKKSVANHVRVRGTVAITKAEKDGNLKVTGNELDYDLINANLAKAILRGNVKLDFLATTPNSGDADLSAAKVEATFKRKTTKDESALQSLAVDGPLTYRGVSVSDKGKALITARADRMSYRKEGDGAEMLLVGNIYFDQKGPEPDDSSEVTGAQSVKLTLNAKGEVTNVRMNSEKPAKIVTKIKSKGGNQG